MLHLLYNIRGVVSRNVIQCYIGWGVVKNFQFLRYIICARPLTHMDLCEYMNFKLTNDKTYFILL